MKWITATFPNLHIHGVARFEDGVFRSTDPEVLARMAPWVGRYGITQVSEDTDPPDLPLRDPWPGAVLDIELFGEDGKVRESVLPARLSDVELRAASVAAVLEDLSVQAAYRTTLSVLEVVPTAEHAAIRAGTSTYDATAVIQALLETVDADTTVVFPPGKYRVGNLQISGKTNFKLIGHGATLELTGSVVTGNIGIQLVGTVTGVEIAGFRILGDGDKAHRHAGVWSDSTDGTIAITDLSVHHNVIEQVNVGVSVNANLGGSIDGFSVCDNVIKDAVGVASGEGYGIHAAFLNTGSVRGLIARNRIHRAGRHSIYVARCADVQVIDNMIVGHRSAITSGEQADATDGRGKTRAAINIARSLHVRVAGNYFMDGYDGAVSVVPNPNLEAGVVLYDVVIEDNHFLRPQNSVPLLIVGDPTPSIAGVPTDVLVQGNDFYADYGALSGVNSVEAIQHNAGKGVTYRGNRIVILGVNQTTAAINVFNREDAAAGSAYNDDLEIVGNTARMTTSNGSICRPIRLDASVSTSAARVATQGNDGFGDSTNEAVVLTATATNPNLRVRNRQGGAVGLYTAADTTPTVARGITEMLVTNAAATSITTLDDGAEGQVVVLRFADANTTLVNSTTIRLEGGTNYVSANRRTVTLVLRSGAWYEVARSNN